MAKNNTDKKPLFGNKRSHALNTTKMRQRLNIQKATVDGSTIKTTVREAKKAKKGSN